MPSVLKRSTAAVTAALLLLSATSSVKGLAAPLRTNQVVTKVAVAGATGRTGRYAVQELLKRDVSQVVALVRDAKKAKEILPNADNLEIQVCDLANEAAIEKALEGVDAAIWAATGFSDSEEPSPLERMKRVFDIAVTPKKSIDYVGVPAFAKCLSNKQANGAGTAPLPKLVMLSSAGVTRTIWDEAKKKRFPGAADIPIIRLNPFNILDVKRESEEKLRASGVDYCIVRPGGLTNDKWPTGSRPVFAQGDVTVGRIHRKDVAKILVDVLSEPQATGKTFECISLAGYPEAVSIGPALARLQTDEQGPLSEDAVAAAYAAMQQLLPGEQQDSAALAMGQTYEQLDQGTVGRLGKRGEEDIEDVVQRPTFQQQSASE